MTVESEAGTRLRCGLGEFPAISEWYGYVDEPGRWDHWPSGFALTWPDEGSANGTIVIDRGDILLPQKSYVSEPIVLTVENGYATRIEGAGCGAAARVRGHVQDPQAYAISHIGWGPAAAGELDHAGAVRPGGDHRHGCAGLRGQFPVLAGAEQRGGGSRTTACHIDIPLRRCTVRLDGREVVREGNVLD